MVSGLVAKASHDLGDSLVAMTHARTALLCAQNAEHGALTAWIRGLQSLISYWGSAPRDALNYAQLGATISGVEGTVSIWLASLEARAWSALGNGAASRLAIENSDNLRDTLMVDELDKLGGICNFSRARQRFPSRSGSTESSEASSTSTRPLVPSRPTHPSRETFRKRSKNTAARRSPRCPAKGSRSELKNHMYPVRLVAMPLRARRLLTRWFGLWRKGDAVG
jgi:hypothetical protein